ncbi:MAG TPA: thioesterase [Flavobacteriales bacterium]|jgi:acyl-CoA thioester hydrolase|nr:thioesterase [Flavobacteriales bacterium]
MSDSAPQNPMNSPFEALGPTVDFEVPLRYSDMDLFGHVNNARYFTFLEEARIAWFEACVPEPWDFRKHGVLVAHNEMDYLKPVEPGDRLIIRLGASGLGNSSIHIRYEGYVLKKGDAAHTALAFRSATTLVSWNTAAGKVTRVHDDWRKAITGE